MPKQSQNCSAKQSQMPLTRGENILPINLMPKQSPIYSMYGYDVKRRGGISCFACREQKPPFPFFFL